MLRFEDYRAHVDALTAVALAAAEPGSRLRAHWHEFEKKSDQFRRCWVIGVGKASLDMALSLYELMGERLTDGAVAAVPERIAKFKAQKALPFRVYPANHPLPDERNITAADAIRKVAEQAQVDDLLICLISGGGSAHLTLPAAGLNLADLQAVTEALLKAGAPIRDLNAVRKHCEQLKGGGLLRLAAPAAVHTFILSDVLGDPLDVIASGPTAPDPTTFEQAQRVLEDYGVQDAAPAVYRHVQAAQQETVKPDDELLALVSYTIIGSNLLAVDAVASAAETQGWHVRHRETGAEGEARDVGARLGAIARQLRALDSNVPQCAVIGGETTVTVTGHGLGGRNQEMALAAAQAVDGMEGVAIAAFGTDGVDGPTEAAGAYVTGQTIQRARTAGLEPDAYLQDNDSHTFFSRLGDLIITGPTGTNVNDLALVLVYPVGSS